MEFAWRITSWSLLRRPLTVQEERVTVVNLSDVELSMYAHTVIGVDAVGGPGVWTPAKILAARVFSGLDPNENFTEINLMSAKCTSGAVFNCKPIKR